MSLGVLNNISAIYAQNNLNSTQSSLSKTLQQLSSGSRINSGADDAAGLAVADGLAANSTALAQSSRNASDAIGLLQTADGALSQVTTLLNRAVTLATEAGNGTLSTSQLSSANQEYQDILTQVNNIGSTTNFNNTSVFSNTARNFFVSDGTSSGSTTYTDTIGTLTTASVGTTAGTAAATTSPTVTNGTAAAYASSTGTAGTVTIALNSTHATDTFGGALTVSYGGNNVSMNIAAGTTGANLVAALNASGGAFATAGITASLSGSTLTLTGATPTGSGSVASNALVAASSGNTFAETVPAGPAGSGQDLSAIALDTSDHAKTVLTNLTTAIADVAYQRGSIGANINQLSSAQSVTSAEQTNLTSAENNITATDYGQAASDLSKYQVLSQTGISALAQANSVQQEVLKLLQ
ncbi:flagellin N-terminal helical domain-containing protein [Terriglobus aquaticus]|uniref:Flagellin n=1 Tax=Terriglobus aquaticus TaxID=940139 RepID=A0ABW9KN38_9BACT|nr:flagellin [Terriglobus aquaticus]